MKTMRTSALVIVTLLAAFPVDAQTADRPEGGIVIEGSNTFGEELGPKLIEAFRERNPDIAIQLGTRGSGAGMDALLDGTAEIASASRVASEDELRRARARGIRLRAHFIGSYGVAVIVHQKSPLRSLTDRQVHDIFTGAITNWKAVGGPDAPIAVYIRDPVSGTHLGFRELAMRDEPYAEGATELLSYAEIMRAVRDNPNGIGYTGMTLVHREPGIRALFINGIPPNAISVNEGMYPYARGLRFYTVRGRESSAARDFIRFVRSADGQKELEREGYVPRMMMTMPQTGIAP